MRLLVPTALSLLGAASLAGGDATPLAGERSTIGNPKTLLAHYQRWAAERGDDAVLELALGWSKGRSAALTSGRGRVRFDLARGIADVVLSGLVGPREVVVWLSQYADHQGVGCAPEADALLRPLTHVALTDGAGRARVALSGLGDFELEAVVVAPAGRNPAEAGLLFGTPDLFQRVRAWELAGGPSSGGGVAGVTLGSATAQSGRALVGPAVLFEFDELIAKGEDLFVNETFDGNGRTCATCHPALNNFTIDVPFISALPANDPLFVAEGDPNLDSTLNGGLVFENPVLMRQFGLIVENLDGFGDLQNRFVMRSVQHTFALALTTVPQQLPLPYPAQFTGWSGDGSPGAGTVRDFAIGAVTQHFPKTLARQEGSDFRLPTPQELTAMEAFQFSLGRPAELALADMTFSDPQAEQGRARFMIVGSCRSCHDDAGALGLKNPIVPDANLNFETAVEAFVQNHPDGTGQPRPVDGGFGHSPDGQFGNPQANPDGGFGTRTFNAQSLIEVADTLPAFHNNATLIPGSPLENTVEGAVRFYTTDEFRNSPPGPNSVFFTDDDVVVIGRLLRVLNALENERATTSFAERAEAELLLPAPDLARVTKLAELGAADAEDAIGVLLGVGLHPNAVADFTQARLHLVNAQSGSIASRLASIQAALPLLAGARADMLL